MSVLSQLTLSKEEKVSEQMRTVVDIARNAHESVPSTKTFNAKELERVNSTLESHKIVLPPEILSGSGDVFYYAERSCSQCARSSRSLEPGPHIPQPPDWSTAIAIAT
ncbi:MAG: hypothetical protein P4M11_10325 [Candidatus Pacebacteria bacterium]|nr:hypothetical protein [Candidatus Paceibacterota bacterium]